MIKILANDGIDAAGKKIFEAAGFNVSTDKVAQEKLAETLKSFVNPRISANKIPAVICLFFFKLS